MGEEESKFALKVMEGDGDDEMIMTRHSQFQIPVNVLNIYGEQENRSTTTEVKERWNRILKVVEDKYEDIIVIGDLNKHVGSGILGVKENNPTVSPGGKLIHDLLEDNIYILV